MEKGMSRIEILGTVDDQHRLSLLVPDQVKPGPVKVILEIADDRDDEWSQGVAEIWARDWNDPREDIYTLKDGEPINDAE
jgi:hypothetical protein